MKAYESPMLQRVAVEVEDALLASTMTGGDVGCVDDTAGGDVVFSAAQKTEIFK